jgi:parvulin-like peptidyl-prolyl isomerase
MKVKRSPLVVLLTVAIFPVAASSAHGQFKAANKPAAVVNGEPISRAEFENALNRMPPFPPDVTEAQKKAACADVLGLMIDEKLLKQFLKKNVPAPDPALIEQRVADLERTLKAKGRTLQDYCKDTGQTEANLRADIASVIQWNAFVKKKVTDADLRRYFEENRELFEGAAVRVSHIAIGVPPGSDLRVKQAAVQKLQGVRKQILSGLDFAEAARKFSEDRSAASGGDLGYLPPRGTDDDPLMRSVAGLKVGQVSEVVPTEYGYHLLKVTERKPGQPTTFDEAKGEVRILYADEMRQVLIAEQRKQAKLEINLP